MSAGYILGVVKYATVFPVARMALWCVIGVEVGPGRPPCNGANSLRQVNLSNPLRVITPYKAFVRGLLTTRVVHTSRYVVK